MAISANKPISATYLVTQLKNFDKQILEAKYNKKFQFKTMPAAEAKIEGVVYQFIGTTDATYTFGYFYTCKAKADASGYEWVAVTQSAPEYTIEKNATPSSDLYTASYSLKKDGVAVGTTIDIPKDYFVTDAFVDTVEEADLATGGILEGETGFAVGDTYLEIDVNIAGKPDAVKPVFVNISKLVDVYTPGDAITIDAANKNAISVALATDSGLKITADKKLAVDFETEDITFDYAIWETV